MSTSEMEDGDKLKVEEDIKDGKNESSSPAVDGETIEFTVVHNKSRHQVEFSLDQKISALKKHFEVLLGVPVTLQKVVYKGMVKDEKTLRESGFTSGCKVMVVGSKLDDVLAISTSPPPSSTSDEKSSGSGKEPLCKQKLHRKVIERGLPDDSLPGIINLKEPLPPFPLCGMLNKSGGKVRLTFKLEIDQLWIGTKERTEKIPMSSIKNIINEPIEGHDQYHIMGLQLGTTEASHYWVYWVPAQYVDSIKEAVLGQCFM